MRLKIGIIDYGLGNVTSIQNALERLECRTVISCDREVLLACDGIILPGVGSFPTAMKAIESSGLRDIIIELAEQEKKPLLGICLGMQILAEQGEEFEKCDGLGLIPGTVKMLNADDFRSIPHVGWSGVDALPAGQDMFARSQEQDAYYFDHSFYFEAAEECCAATLSGRPLVCVAVARDNIWGMQFHPEKSQNAGLRLMKAFVLRAAGNPVTA
ncbi:MAG: imidazole glycerol phosphate synthase subunit HisH [Verrucomicrobiota bacterium]